MVLNKNYLQCLTSNVLELTQGCQILDNGGGPIRSVTGKTALKGYTGKEDFT